ncbi:MAG: phosphonate ABC transporter, permease protein PhnE [Rhodospirillales bacterium]
MLSDRNKRILYRNGLFVLGFGLPLALSLYFILGVQTDWARMSTFDMVVKNLEKFLPPNLSVIPDLMDATLDTILIAFLATLVIAALVPPVVWLSSRNITPNIVFYYVGRGIIIISRSVHELVWALIFVIAVGLGPLAGIMALGIRGIGFVSKIVSEEVEAIDVRPIEALRATGASTLNVIILAVIPQIVPVFLGTLIFQWEIDLRRAAVIGVVGGGGLGLAFHQAMIQFKWHDAMAIVVILIVIVAVGEIVSRMLRKRII